jgi:hypothetical protein
MKSEMLVVKNSSEVRKDRYKGQSGKRASCNHKATGHWCLPDRLSSNGIASFTNYLVHFDPKTSDHLPS